MYIGLDIGTSGSKADLIDENGNVHGSGQMSYSFSNTANGFRELDAQNVWEAVKKCLNDAASGKKVDAITVSCFGEAIVLVDQNGKPIGPGITGTDIRGIDELSEITKEFGVRTLTDITGLNLSIIYSANKILWIRKHQPDMYQKANKILTFQDYIIYCLCHEAMIDYSMASRTLLFDINKQEWSENILSWSGIEREKLAKPVPAGTVAGTLKCDVAKELNLSADTKIIVGTHDHICNAIGSGVCEVGSCVDTVGTTEGLTAVLNRSTLNPDNIERYQISCEPFAVKGLYNTVAWNNTSGVLLKWFVNEMVKEEEPEKIISTFSKMNRQMKAAPTDLFVLPHFSGSATPYMDSTSKGAILGLTLDTKRIDVYKALMEGANYELAVILDALQHSGLKVSRIVATGGALSPELLQIKADILGMPVYTVKNRQTGTLGGAVLGVVTMGIYNSLKEGIQNMVIEDRIYIPDNRNTEIYREKFAVYKKIYPAIAEISHKMIKRG